MHDITLYHDLIDIRDRVLARMMRDGLAGADPFDGLESPVFRASGLGKWRWARLGWLQAIKRGPDILRKIAAIPPLVNPKTLAVLNGAAGGVVLGTFGDRLLAMQNSDGGWGYPFEWQARAFHARAGQSNGVVTGFVMDGLIAGGLAADHPALLQAAAFLEKALWRDGYFAYVDHDDTEIHNASLWAAFALDRVRPGNRSSQQALRRVLAAQHSDGHWCYGTRHHHRFVDGIHTGFVLDLLDRLRKSGKPGMAGLDDAIERGWAFYRRACFDDNDMPRRLAGRDGYVDAHSLAQAMASLCRFDEVATAKRLAERAVTDLFDPAGDVFYAGIGRLGRDRRNYMRWTQAWMVWGLSIVIEKMTMTSKPNSMFDPTRPLSFAHPDPQRADREAALRALSADALRSLYAITRRQAAIARSTGEMEVLYGLTRGLKTLQRISGERGILLQARPTSPTHPSRPVPGAG